MIRSERIQQARTCLDRLKGRREAAQSRVTGLMTKSETEGHRIDIQLQAVELLQQLLDVLIRSKAKEVSALLSDGCASIFSDMELAVEEEVGIERNKVSVTFETVETKGDTVIRGDAVESFGGGVAAVQGMLLRLYTVLGKDWLKIIVADEPLATVSAQYVPAVGSFLRRICESAGLDLLMITHQKGFQEHAHTLYDCSRKGDETVVKRLE